MEQGGQPMQDAAIVETGPAGQADDQAWSQYVTFTVDRRIYGIEITEVREIKGWSEPTELPNSPYAMRGVQNLRGVIVPIFDLRAQFGLGETDAREEHVVIIVTLGERLIGVLVDAVSDILTLGPG
jgi:purine-binding chemotaxis protein CheW